MMSWMERRLLFAMSEGIEELLRQQGRAATAAKADLIGEVRKAAFCESKSSRREPE